MGRVCCGGVLGAIAADALGLSWRWRGDCPWMETGRFALRCGSPNEERILCVPWRPSKSGRG
eukprot:5346970-Prymnesium_polylepis.1